ncbi:MAG: hypothetical protein K2X68_12985, partial [Novosphingobium sp.]|nr:hypothetical protein [Novosphingobium sp.]
QGKVRAALAAGDVEAIERLKLALVGLTMVDATGAYLFADESELAAFDAFNPAGFEAAWAAVQELNGMTPVAEDQTDPLPVSATTS